MVERAVVAVFGGSGFLGSHVVDELHRRGYHVRIIDKNDSPYRTSNQEMIIGDILDLEFVKKVCKDAAYVFNFAGLADINEAKDKPMETIHLNVLGTLNILEACRTQKVKRFIFASSVYVFSEIGSFYSVSKQTAEKLVEQYFERYSQEYTIIRYGSLYGRRADKRNTMYNFIDGAFKKEISYSGNGDEQREYIHVTDASRISVDLLSDKFKNCHLVLTGNQMMKVRDVMKMIQEIFKWQPNLKFANEPREGHYSLTPYSYQPRVGRKIIANPFVDLGQGILDCIHEMEGRFRNLSDSPTKAASGLDERPQAIKMV